jgi:hypothetical protein
MNALEIISTIIGIVGGTLGIVAFFKLKKIKISFKGPIFSVGLPAGIQMISFDILNKGNTPAYFTSNPSFISGKKTTEGYPVLFPYGMNVNPKLPCKLEPSQKLSVCFPREGFIESIKEWDFQKLQFLIKDDVGTTYKSEWINTSKF